MSQIPAASTAGPMTPALPSPLPPKPKRKRKPKDQVKPRKKPVYESSLNTLKLFSPNTPSPAPIQSSSTLAHFDAIAAHQPVQTSEWQGVLGSQSNSGGNNSPESVGHTPDLNTSPDLSWSSSIDTLYTPADDFSPATRPNTPENDMASFTFSFQLPIGLGRDPSPPPVEQVPTTAPAPEAQPKTDKETKPKAVERILGYLREASITPLEMILIILDDENTGLVNFRNRLFEQHERIFDFIDIIKDHKRTSSAFGQWMDAPALDHVSRKVFEEGEAAKPFLRMETTDITTDFVEKWSVQDLIGPVAANVTPTLTRILTVATSPKFLKPEERSEEDEVDIEPGAKPGEGRNRETARLLLASQIHYLRSHFSCQVQVAIGLVAWANGCSQQLNDILHQADC